MEFWELWRRERLLALLRELGLSVEDAFETLARMLGREVALQPPDPGTQLAGPLAPKGSVRPWWKWAI